MVVSKSKAILQTAVSIVTALGANTIPAGIVFLDGQAAETAMLLYFLENILAVILAAVCVRLLAPAQDEGYASAVPDHTEIRVNGRLTFRGNTLRDRTTLLRDYLVISSGLSLGSGVFLVCFLFLILRADIPKSAILSGFTGIAGFQLLNFVANLLWLRPLSAQRATFLLQQSLGRVALLYLAVGVGFVLALFVERWFVLPFAVLKTIVDLAAPFQARQETIL